MDFDRIIRVLFIILLIINIFLTSYIIYYVFPHPLKIIRDKDITTNTTDMINEIKIPNYIHTIYFTNRTYTDWCGFYLIGGLIKINLKEECTTYGTKWIFEHELRHAYWFQKMKYPERLEWCKKQGYTNAINANCWEDYAYTENELG